MSKNISSFIIQYHPNIMDPHNLKLKKNNNNFNINTASILTSVQLPLSFSFLPLFLFVSGYIVKENSDVCQ